MIISSLRALWRWRGFITETVRRDISSRYAGASLGAIWHFIQPLTQILIYTLVFSEVMRARLPGNPDAMAYGIFLCAGILPWQLFSEILGRSSGMFVDNATFLKKSSFPRICVPISVALSSLVHFTIIAAIFLLMLVILGRFPGLVLLSAIPLLLLLMVMAASAGLLVGTLNVFLRDVGQIMVILLQFLFWLTPIVWPLQTIPAAWQAWFSLNPLFGIMQGFQSIFIEGRQPDWTAMGPACLAALLLTVLALIYFRRFSGELTDEL